MATGAHRQSVVSFDTQPLKQTARRRERLRIVQLLTREEQIALIEEARAARLAREQKLTEGR